MRNEIIISDGESESRGLISGHETRGHRNVRSRA